MLSRVFGGLQRRTAAPPLAAAFAALLIAGCGGGGGGGGSTPNQTNTTIKNTAVAQVKAQARFVLMFSGGGTRAPQEKFSVYQLVLNLRQTRAPIVQDGYFPDLGYYHMVINDDGSGSMYYYEDAAHAVSMGSIVWSITSGSVGMFPYTMHFDIDLTGGTYGGNNACIGTYDITMQSVDSMTMHGVFQDPVYGPIEINITMSGTDTELTMTIDSPSTGVIGTLQGHYETNGDFHVTGSFTGGITTDFVFHANGSAEGTVVIPGVGTAYITCDIAGNVTITYPDGSHETFNVYQ